MEDVTKLMDIVNIDRRRRNTSRHVHNQSCTNALRDDRLATLGEMVVGVTHDLNNALAPMVTLVELLSGSDNLSDQQQKWIEAVMAGADHAVRLVRNIQQFCEESAPENCRELIDLCELIRSVREITRSLWERPDAHGKIAFQLELTPVPCVWANMTELRQVLVNLISNGVDAMESGGILTISLSYCSRSGIAIDVSDTGVGMSDETIRRCFEQRFTTKQKGSGIGLRICQKIVRAHHGSIEVDSQEERGTVFRIFLPANLKNSSIQKTIALNRRCVLPTTQREFE